MCETKTGQQVAQLHDSWVVVVVVMLVVVVMTDVEDTVLIWGSTYARCSKHYFQMYNTVHGYT